MKKQTSILNQRTYLTVVVLLAMTTVVQVQAQDRRVVWIHGFGANGAAWNIYEAFTEGVYMADGGSPNFNSGTGMPNFQAEVAAQDQFQNGRGTLGIGHSAGGVALRGAVLQPFNFYDAIINVGSANRGAAVVNALQNGDVGRASVDACNDLLAGPSSNLPLVSVIVRGIAQNVICDMVERQVLRPLLGQVAVNATANDLRVGSPYLAGVNAGGTPVPTISIWGSETTPIHWRYLSSTVNGPQDDQTFVDVASDMRDIYQGFEVANILRGPFGVWSATRWARGKRWFDNSTGVFNALLDCRGGRFRVTGTRAIATNPCDAVGYTGSAAWIECVRTRCNNNYNSCSTITIVNTTVESNNESDGLVCEESQVAPNISEANIYRAAGVNHAQELNTTGPNATGGNGDVMRATLERIYRRDDVFGLTPG